MKKFAHIWTEDYFLLHIQLTIECSLNSEVTIVRELVGRHPIQHILKIDKNVSSYRFMISRMHPDEKSFFIVYSQNIILEAFMLDDRAYYPTESFFRS